MKRQLLVFIVSALSVIASAQQKVAILETVDKAQNVGYGVKLLLRSSLTSAISNTPGYEGYDRVDMASIAGEQEFQRTGNVSDSQIKQLGVATGASYVLVAEAALYDDRNIIITAKILDVETFGIKSSAVLVSGISPKDMQNSCADLAKQLLKPEPVATNAAKPASKPASNSKQPAPQPTVQPVAMPPAIGLSGETSTVPLLTHADGTTVYVATADEKDRLNYDDAVSSCSCKGAGWRLPNEAELQVIRTNKSILNISTTWRYWGQYAGKTIDMGSGRLIDTKNSVKAKVRCVKEER